MDGKVFRFVLSKDNLVEYYQYILGSLPKNKRIYIWLKACIPVLLLFTLVFFRLYSNVLLDVGVILLAVVWLVYISEMIWISFLRKRAEKLVVTKLKADSARAVEVRFDDSKIIVDSKKIEYTEIQKVIPLKSTLVFFYRDSSAFVIPQDVIGSEDDIRELYKFILTRKERTSFDA